MDLELAKTKIEEKLKSLGYSLYSLKKVSSKAGPTLEVVVDRFEAINLDDIVSVSQELSTLLDEIDKSEEPYVLDVSSLGAEKPILPEELYKYVGKYVNIHLTNPYKGLNFLEGDIESFNEEDGTFILAYKEKTRTIRANVLAKDVDKARLAIKF